MRRLCTLVLALAVTALAISASAGATFPPPASFDPVVTSGSTADAQGGDQELAREWAPTRVSRYGEMSAWSSLDKSSGLYHLVVHDGRSTRRLPVKPRPVPFDVDLGPDRRGDTVAAYSRCDQEPRLGQQTNPALPVPATARGCDIYIFSLAPAANPIESKVRGASTQQASEFLPTIWRGRIAFARIYERREGRRGALPYLYVRELDGGRSQRLAGGSRGQTGLPGPTGLDLYGARLGILWKYKRPPGRVRSEVRVDTIDGPARVAAFVQDRSGARYSLAGLALDEDRLLWGTDCVGRLCRQEGHHAAYISRQRLARNGTGGDVAFLSADRRLVWAAPGFGKATIVQAEGFAIQPGGAARCRSLADPQLNTVQGCIVTAKTLRFGPPAA